MILIQYSFQKEIKNSVSFNKYYYFFFLPPSDIPVSIAEKYLAIPATIQNIGGGEGKNRQEYNTILHTAEGTSSLQRHDRVTDNGQINTIKHRLEITF